MDPRSNQHQLRRGEIRSAPFPPQAFGFRRELRSAPLPLLFIENLRIFDELRDEKRLSIAPYVNRVRPGKQTYYMTLLFTCQVLSPWRKSGDPYRIRTDVNGVRGRCLNHLTNGPGRRKLRFTRSRQKPTAFVESSLRSVAPPLPQQTQVCFGFSRGTMGERTKSGTGIAEGDSLNQVYPLDTPSSELVHLHGLEPGTH